MKLVVTALARSDLNGIAQYTLEKWGRAQLLDYIGGLLDTLDQIAEKPELGKSVPKIPVRFVRVPYRSHFVFYTLAGGKVRITRILHQSMDVARHIN